MTLSKTGRSWRIIALIAAAAWAMIGLLLPATWFQPAAVNGELPAPAFDGLILMRACFVLEALLAGAAVLMLKRWQHRALEPTPIGAADDRGDDVSARFAHIAVALLTLTAAALRLYKLDSPLWLDEISPVADYGQLSTIQVFSTYLGSNNHVLNTILVNGMVTAFGVQEWAVRLPAAIFGIASIPAIYLLARTALSKRVSLCAAALLTFSYHHIFFSQNARGYSAYLFFSVMASWLFVRALRSNRITDWSLYITAAVFAVMSLLNGIFVLAAHAIVAAYLAFRSYRKSGHFLEFAPLGMVYGLISLILLHLYSLVIPQIYSVMHTTYKMKSAGFSSPFSPEFVRDLFTGLPPILMTAAVLGGPLLAFTAAVGLFRLVRNSPAIAAILILPNLLLAALVIFERLAVTPRLFFFALVPTVIILACGIAAVATILARQFRKPIAPAMLALGTICLAIGLGAGLVRYYAIPKQNYPAAIRFVTDNRKPGDIIIVIYLARYGYRFYAPRLGSRLDKDTYFIRDPEVFNAVLAQHPGARIWMVSTFERALRLDLPEIYGIMQSRSDLVGRFQGTIGDGNVLVYTSAPSVSFDRTLYRDPRLRAPSSPQGRAGDNLVQ